MCLPFLVLKVIRYLFMLVISLLIAYFVVTLYQVYKESTTAKPIRSQAIVVMGSSEDNGSPSPDLVARLREAETLFRENYAPTIFLTGGARRGGSFTEAGVGKTYLESQGISAADLVSSSSGRDTWGSLTAVSKLLKARGISSAIVVSDGYHLLRSTQILGSLGFSVSAAAAANSPVQGVQLYLSYAREAVAVAAGRVVGYKFLSLVRHGI